MKPTLATLNTTHSLDESPASSSMPKSSRVPRSTPPPLSGPISASGIALEPRVIDVFLHYLKVEGVREVFGIAGGLLYPFFESVERDSEMRLITTKHEEGAAFMADGYARTSHRLSVCAGTSGPGSTNLITGVACAFSDGVPLLVLTGQAASHALGKGAAQETTREDMDIVAMFRPITKYSTMVTSPGSMAHHLRRALRLAMTGKPGPVHLNVPVDLWEKTLTEDWFDPHSYRPTTHTFDRDSVKQAVEVLVAARHPILLAGSGVSISSAEEQLLSLAEMIPARVATTPRAKGVFPEDHPLSLGVFGVAGHNEAREIILGDEHADVLFTVGASLNETSTLNWTPQLKSAKKLIQLDIDADRIGRNYPVDVSLVGDAQTILVELIYHMHRYVRERKKFQSQWASSPPIMQGLLRYTDAGLRTSSQVPLAPQRWRAELQDVLPENVILFSDIGGHMLFNIHHLSIKKHQKFVINLGFGSMGHGILAPIGASFANPGKPIISIVGDGGFAMNGMDLLTAVEYDVPVVWIVENNNMHGITWHCSRALSDGRGLEAAKHKKKVDISGIARAMGLFTMMVDAPGQIQEAVQKALQHKGPSLIEVRVDGSIPPPAGARTQSLAGFIDR